MTGIILLLAIAIWAVVAYALTKGVASKIPKGSWRVPGCLGIFFVLFALPILDEVIGIFQFQHLCRHNAVINVDRSKAVGKTVYLADVPSEEVRGTWVRVVRRPVRFLEAATGEPVVSYDRLTAYGGWFTRVLGISEGNAPLLFRGSCVPGDRLALDRLFKELNITLIRR